MVDEVDEDLKEEDLEEKDFYDEDDEVVEEEEAEGRIFGEDLSPRDDSGEPGSDEGKIFGEDFESEVESDFDMSGKLSAASGVVERKSRMTLEEEVKDFVDEIDREEEEVENVYGAKGDRIYGVGEDVYLSGKDVYGARSDSVYESGGNDFYKGASHYDAGNGKVDEYGRKVKDVYAPTLRDIGDGNRIRGGSNLERMGMVDGTKKDKNLNNRDYVARGTV